MVHFRQMRENQTTAGNHNMNAKHISLVIDDHKFEQFFGQGITEPGV